ncbi:hypothetical protein BpHYR1_031734 [Brachionus plicatilis]|uniref:Uncharacterized protein n=1 Tax=Brachionus plicatilis TaxID=10195 RepID=A0A3M7SFN7_BRAPC|nr:hypothetical protein BpHYR1_031734 [Brachionus plicatilis]
MSLHLCSKLSKEPIWDLTEFSMFTCLVCSDLAAKTESPTSTLFNQSSICFDQFSIWRHDSFTSKHWAHSCNGFCFCDAFSSSCSSNCLPISLIKLDICRCTS